MGNYENIEIDFIERTMELIEQYQNDSAKYSADKQFNHTLILNCMLGLIVMPKEKILTYVPKDRLITAFKESIGIINSEIDPDIKTLQELIHRLRNCIAHFDIQIKSEDDNNRIDVIEFLDSENGNKLIARFRENEIFPFLKQYSEGLLTNYKNHI